MSKELMRNAEGYFDPTAFAALKTVINEDKHKMNIYVKGDVVKYGTKNSGYGNPLSENYGVVISGSTNLNAKTTVIIARIVKSDAEFQCANTHVPILCKVPSVALCETIRAVRHEDVTEFVRTCNGEELDNLNQAIMKVFDLNADYIPEAPKHEDHTEELASQRKIISDLQKELAKAVEQKNESPQPDAVITAERNLYKQLYEALLDKVVSKGV